MFKTIVLAAMVALAASKVTLDMPTSLASAANKACKKRCKTAGGRNCYAMGYFKR